MWGGAGRRAWQGLACCVVAQTPGQCGAKAAGWGRGRCGQWPRRRRRWRRGPLRAAGFEKLREPTSYTHTHSPHRPPAPVAPHPSPTTSRKALEAEDAEFETSKGVRVVSSFDAMNLKEGLLRGIYQFGFEKPSAIQQRAILPIVAGRDVIAQAQSGTGKTSLIAITLCQMLDTSLREVQALVLSPTRELATQTQLNVAAIGDHLAVQSHACIGGKSVGDDIRKLEAGVHIVSGTPGRVFDMIQRRSLRTRCKALGGVGVGWGEQGGGRGRRREGRCEHCCWAAGCC